MSDCILNDAQQMITKVIKDNLPDTAVQNALEEYNLQGDIYLLAIGKAAWSMAKAASDYFGERVKQGLVVTKYEHSNGDIPNTEIIEAAHPLSDANTIIGAEKAIAMAEKLTENDQLVFLISGGGSALFEKPVDGVSLDQLIEINNQLLASGADIVEINIIRKRLSSVKAGRFAQLCSPAKVYTIVLSDVLGDRLDSIASGPAAPDLSTADDAMQVVNKYGLKLSGEVLAHLQRETPKQIDNVKTIITGSIRTLCDSAAKCALELGYTPHIITSTMNCEAKEAGRLISSMASEIGVTDYSFKAPCALILGGETVVRITGKGLGGRNQETALAAAESIAGRSDVVIFSLGSDGTDGPTDAAGGIVDGSSLQKLKDAGLDLHEVLQQNDSYNALKAIDGLIFTGPTGTNINDIAVLLCK